MDINYNKNFFKKEEDNQSAFSDKSKKNTNKVKFKQLKSYFNFKLYLKKELSSKEKKEESFYLIDKNWIQEWKKCVVYDKIKKYYKNLNLNRDLNDEDYNWIESIIKNNSNNKFLPFDNSKIYYNNEINLLADFVIANELCYESFTLESIKNINLLKEKSFQATIVKEKIILKIK